MEAEYGVSNVDSPHRIVLAPVVKLPSPGNERSLAHVLAGGWNASAIVETASGSPLNAVLSAAPRMRTSGCSAASQQRPNLIGDPNTSGGDQDRVSSADHPDARWFGTNAFASPGPGQCGNAPRTIANARYQFRKNVDVVLAKATRFVGGQQGEIRFEILNVTNTPKFRGIDSNSIDVSTFGRITAQAGFMRSWQLSFRYRF